MRDWSEALEWYRHNNTTDEIGFNPDGMCLKVCRTARDIGARFLSAKEAQDNTPTEHRVLHVQNLRRGMVLFFDDVNDSNKYGHIVTMIGRVKGADLDSLNDILVRTNSVKTGQLVVVRGSYFQEHWGDEFQFGATWLNGVELDVPARRVRHRPNHVWKSHFRDSRPDWDVKILDRAFAGGRRGLNRYINAIEREVESIDNDVENEDVREFLRSFKNHRVLKLYHLSDVPVRFTQVRTVRNNLRAIVKQVLR